MAWAWNDALDETTDWTDRALAVAFWGAHNERQFGSGTVTVPADQDYCARPPTIASALAIDRYWVKTHSLSGGVWSAVTNYDGAADLAMWTSPAGVPGGSASFYNYVWGDATMRYSRPREITSLSAATYPDGDSISNGEFARKLNVNNRRGRVYERVGGAWQLAENPLGQAPTVDVAPNNSDLYDPPDPDNYWNGYYCGPEFWRAKMRACNAMIWTAHQIDFYDNEIKTVTSTSFVSEAAAKSAAETAWASASWTSNVIGPEAWSSVAQNGSGTSWTATLTRKRAKLKITSIPTAVNSAVDWYLPTEEVGEFDANGDDVIQDAWSLLSTSAAANTAERTYAHTFSDQRPAWPTASPAAGFTVKRGWSMWYTGPFIIPAAVCRWNVSGGFTYVPA